MFLREVTIICTCDMCGVEQETKQREWLGANYSYINTVMSGIELPTGWEYVPFTAYRAAYHNSYESYTDHKLSCPQCISREVV